MFRNTQSAAMNYVRHSPARHSHSGAHSVKDTPVDVANLSRPLTTRPISRPRTNKERLRNNIRSFAFTFATATISCPVYSIPPDIIQGICSRSSAMLTSQASDEALTGIHAEVATLLDTLQINSIFHSLASQTPASTPSYHSFFLNQLPLLLTAQKLRAIRNLRRACTCVAGLSSSAEKSVRTRYVNFVRSLCWALDHADDLLRSVGVACELRIMKAIRTIFHLVASLCYREWEVECTFMHHLRDSVHGSPGRGVPSARDPVYNPPVRVGPCTARPGLVVGDPSERIIHEPQFENNRSRGDQSTWPNASHNTIDKDPSIPAVEPLSSDSSKHRVVERSDSVVTAQDGNTTQVSRPSKYIQSGGKHILPAACIQETTNGCHVPFELFVKDNSMDQRYGMFDLPVCHVGVSYPDNTCFPYIPVHDIRLVNPCTTHGDMELDMLSATVDISTNVYQTIINRLKKAYSEKFPGVSHTFLSDTNQKHTILDNRLEIKIPVLLDCFARVVNLFWFVESPLWKALEMCQHDAFGYGLLQAEFVESLEGTTVILSLAGIIVERNLLNYGEKIFEQLDTGVVTDF